MYCSSWQSDPLGPRTLHASYARLALSVLLEACPDASKDLRPQQRAILDGEQASRLTLLQWHDLLDLTQCRLRSRDIVPLMAERFMPWQTGLLGFTLMTSPSIEKLAGLLRRYQALLSDAFVLEIGLVNRRFFMRLRDAGPESSPRLARLLLCTWGRHLSWLTGQEDLKLDAHFEGPHPPDLAPYRRMLGGHVRFGQSENAIYGDASYTKLPIVSHDASSHEFLKSQTHGLAARMFPERTRLIDQLNSLLYANMESRVMSLEEAATALGVPTRVLKRRLDESGLTFRQMIDNARRMMAERYLAHTDMPLAQMASALGFSDHASFNRAFKRWSGASPGAFRKTSHACVSPWI